MTRTQQHQRRLFAGLPTLLWLSAGILLVTAQGQTPTEIVLHNFAGYPPKGYYPENGVIRDAAGNLYGTTDYGGAANAGVVYRVDVTGHEMVLYSFTGGADGGGPSSGVIRDPAGNLFGTTDNGGAGYGVVYKVDGIGHETVLHAFTGADGAYPSGGVIRDKDGNLYGATRDGGTGNCLGLFCGVVYKLDATGHETVLYSFTGGADGGLPEGGLIQDSAGNLYGTTEYGGTGCAAPGCGVVYKVDPSGQESVVYAFTGGADGGNPQVGVIGDAAGNLYGTTQFGGAANWGTVYRVDAAGDKTVLYSFTSGTGGAKPDSSVIRDSAGNLYGVCSVTNTLYKVDPAGNETVLYSFTGGADGGGPNGALIRDADGNIYGTTYYGGPADEGVVYKLDAAGHETALLAFKAAVDGDFPRAGVIRDTAGNLFGTTFYGGTSDAGLVYKVDATGRETVLYSFKGGTDGGWPQYGVTMDAAGNLYGTTSAGGGSTKCTMAAAWCTKWIRRGMRRCCTASRAMRTGAYPPAVSRWTQQATFTGPRIQAVHWRPAPMAVAWYINWTPLAMRRCFTTSQEEPMADSHPPVSSWTQQATCMGPPHTAAQRAVGKVVAWCINWTPPDRRQCCTASPLVGTGTLGRTGATRPAT